MRKILLLLIFANCALGKCPEMTSKDPWVLILTNENLPVQVKQQLGFIHNSEAWRNRAWMKIYKQKIEFQDYATLKNFVLRMKQANPNKKLEFTYDKFRITKEFFVTLIKEDSDYDYTGEEFTKTYHKGIGYR